MNRWKLALAGVLLAAAPAAAQRVISPGMSEAQVRSVLGNPATSRTTAGWTYLYYHNGCPIRCGSDDVVFLEDGKVVAAVFRTGARRFSGPPADDALEESSEGSAEVRRSGGEAQADEGPAVVGGIRIGGARTTRIDEGRTASPAEPLRRQGSRESAAASDSAFHGDDPAPITDPPVGTNAQQQARERRVEPNSITNQRNPEAQRASGELDRQRRERAVTPNSIAPQRDTTPARQP